MTGQKMVRVHVEMTLPGSGLVAIGFQVDAEDDIDEKVFAEAFAQVEADALRYLQDYKRALAAGASGHDGGISEE